MSDSSAHAALRGKHYLRLGPWLRSDSIMILPAGSLSGVEPEPSSQPEDIRITKRQTLLPVRPPPNPEANKPSPPAAELAPRKRSATLVQCRTVRHLRRNSGSSNSANHADRD